MDRKRVNACIEEIVKARKADGGLKQVFWVAAGGSNGGFFPAQYFMDRESKSLRSQSFTSNEFFLAPPSSLGKNSLVILCSMRGTAETCDAASLAKERGATTIALYIEESKLTEVCDYSFAYESISYDETEASEMNASYGLFLAMVLLKKLENYEHFDLAIESFSVLDRVYRDAWNYTLPLAKKWAERNKNESVIWVLAGGPAYGAGYIFSICNLEEMQWISSPTVNTCEFVHGPFECTDKNLPMFILISEGRTRPADERVLAFLKKHTDQNIYVLDAKELGLSRIDKRVSEYFNHLLFSPILNNVYLRALAIAKNHDYHYRRYMWQEKY
ncbi:SIS domain-containing protein [uncultured Sphaerochaeta sp.]|uniref:SIS domain-containing protein n=1 Tax=uncultured Sphaerochaeta sp. TaxID=886478 RepID=UPI002A0A17BE|nr:SIS domain-containing protein [uncultured Sphaerochaeta sp.]